VQLTNQGFDCSVHSPRGKTFVGCFGEEGKKEVGRK
jgi:hypothetical protein